METIETHFMDKAINGLKKIVSEIEDFQVQLTLGKAEAADNYEKAKKKFNELIHDTKNKLNLEKEKMGGLKKKFEELENLFEHDKSLVKQDIQQQKQKFIVAVDEIEKDIKKYT